MISGVNSKCNVSIKKEIIAEQNVHESFFI